MNTDLEAKTIDAHFQRLKWKNDAYKYKQRGETVKPQ